MAGCAHRSARDRAECLERQAVYRARRAEKREQGKAEAERQRKARLARRTVPCTAPGCEVPVPQDGDTPAELIYCTDHRERFRRHRGENVKSGQLSRWLRANDRVRGSMP